jgi:hypothetical protein
MRIDFLFPRTTVSPKAAVLGSAKRANSPEHELASGAWGSVRREINFARPGRGLAPGKQL